VERFTESAFTDYAGSHSLVLAGFETFHPPIIHRPHSIAPGDEIECLMTVGAMSKRNHTTGMIRRQASILVKRPFDRGASRGMPPGDELNRTNFSDHEATSHEGDQQIPGRDGDSRGIATALGRRSTQPWPSATSTDVGNSARPRGDLEGNTPDRRV
jgi:hypothetical protein